MIIMHMLHISGCNFWGHQVDAVGLSINSKTMVYNILRLDWHVIITSTMLLLFCCFTTQQ